MSPARDLYDVLGVPRDADAEDIKRAYRALAREHHPDVNADPEAEERFKEVAGAYEILSDPQKRAQYDTFGAAGPGGQPFTDIQDIFDLFFGGGTGRRRSGPRSRSHRGEDLRVVTQLTFGEGAFGVRRDLTIERLAVCSRCMGNGAEPGTAPITCPTCGGSGQVEQLRRSVFGTLMTAAPCATCEGTGQQITDRCSSCNGRGRKQEPGTVSVDIPAGVSDGMELRVGGAGNAGVSGGPSGDLYVALQVTPSPTFERRAQDIFTVLDVSVTQATLGADLEIEGLDQAEHVKIEPGTESGTVIKLKGRGVPNLNRRGRGDIFVTLHVVTPRDLSKEERTLYQQLADLRGENGKGGRTRVDLRRPEFR
jgi:molecular chaperone DnaJ